MMIPHPHMPLCAKLTYQLKLVLVGLSFQGEFPWKQHTKISHHSYEFAEDFKQTGTPSSAFIYQVWAFMSAIQWNLGSGPKHCKSHGSLLTTKLITSGPKHCKSHVSLLATKLIGLGPKHCKSHGSLLTTKLIRYQLTTKPMHQRNV